jgi:hypothetical protein
VGAVQRRRGDVEEVLGHAPFAEVWGEGVVEFDHCEFFFLVR